MRNFVAALLLLLTHFNRSHAISLQEITYESLKANAYTDHVEVFQHLFNELKIESMLEFGLGLGTKFFLDRIPALTSVEIVTLNQSKSWFSECCALFKSCLSWTPILYEGSSYLTQANDLALKGENPTLYDTSYLREIETLVLRLTEKNYDLAFVDPGICTRCDIVNFLFNRVDIIAAHDTNFAPELYGWDRIASPENYQKISFSNGVGLTFWVRKERGDAINALLKIQQEQAI